MQLTLATREAFNCPYILCLPCLGAQGKRGRHQLHASTVETHLRSVEILKACKEHWTPVLQCGEGGESVLNGGISFGLNDHH